ncbi:MAG: hypothetical protein D6807_08610 [Alphaproteobacteria bacterium]|nr:MAG: hypothetical protein D6807_08610 [Alphaproteobacteria bacterium]
MADVGEACLKRAKSQRFTSIPASNWESALLGFTYVKNFIEGTAGSAEMLPFAEKIGPLVDQFLELKEERASYSTTKRKEPK